MLISLAVVWGETTIPVVDPDLSPFSHLIRDLKHPNQFSIQIFTLLPLVSAFGSTTASPCQLACITDGLGNTLNRQLVWFHDGIILSACMHHWRPRQYSK